MNYNPATARPIRPVQAVRSVRLEDIQDQLKPSLAINDRRLSHACVTASDEFGCGVFSWHSSEEAALQNAELTGGKSVPVDRDANGEVMLPKEAVEALKLVIGE
jgi:hypothetical protein